MADVAQRLPEMANSPPLFRPMEHPPEDGVSLLEQALKKSGWRGPTKTGRNAKTNFCIIDAQSVKNTDCARTKGYDAGKKVSGIKRHIVVDSQGLPTR